MDNIVKSKMADLVWLSAVKRKDELLKAALESCRAPAVRLIGYKI